MKLITWNCNMAFRKKAKHIFKYNPDILVLQECERSYKIPSELFGNKPTSPAIWYGDNKNKGIGIFTFNGYKAKVIEPPKKNDKWFIPIKIIGPEKFKLIAVWAMNYRANEVVKGVRPAFASIKGLHKYLDSGVIMAGDFNDNVCWNYKKRGKGDFTDKQLYLQSLGIQSAYHIHNAKPHGNEPHPTIVWMKNMKTTYHIDYVFCGEKWQGRIKAVSIEKPGKWLKYSDHVPVMVEFGG
ncbi:MAG TPA: hypothetical protein PLB12_04255 [Candidatus Goldiibacteriota bacterium]|nr:hypothetical protein [Candidatus Goldiibacteriota bacterium]